MRTIPREIQKKVAIHLSLCVLVPQSQLPNGAYIDRVHIGLSIGILPLSFPVVIVEQALWCIACGK